MIVILHVQVVLVALAVLVAKDALVLVRLVVDNVADAQVTVMVLDVMDLVAQAAIHLVIQTVIQVVVDVQVVVKDIAQDVEEAIAV